MQHLRISPLVLILLALASATHSAQLVTPARTAGDPLNNSFWWADYDGDGLDDALVVSPNNTARLLHNEGDGILRDVSLETGLSGISLARLALWQDIDGDGDLDLFIGALAGESRLFLQQAGTFVDAGAEAGFIHRGEVLHAGFHDYDADGALDLHVRTRTQELLYQNLGSGIFQPVEIGQAPAIPIGALSAPSKEVAPEKREGATPPVEPGMAVGDEPDAPVSGSGIAETDAERSSRPAAGRHALPSGPGESATGTNTAALTAGTLPFLENPICAGTIRDQTGGGCLRADSTPSMGRLYPISQDLFVSASNGFVGINTTAPDARLHAVATIAQVSVKGESKIVPTTRGYLGVQGSTDFDGVTSADWFLEEIGVAGISTGASALDNYGVRGHSNGVAVRGEYSGDPTTTFGELGTRNGVGVRASGSSLAGEFLGDVEVTDGDLQIFASTMQSILLDGNEAGGGARMALNNAAGNTTIEMDAETGIGATIEMFNNLGDETIELDSDSGGGARLSLRNDNGATRIILDGDDSNGGSGLFVASDGSSTLFLDGEGPNNGGLVSVRNDVSQATIELVGDRGSGRSGEIAMYDRINGGTSVIIRAALGVGPGGQIALVSPIGLSTVNILGNQAGSGGITLSEPDGSTACDLVGTTYSFRDSSGTPTISFNRLTGTKSAVVDTPSYGQRLFYTMESPEIWFEDFGSGRLSRGSATIQLDPIFLESVTINQQYPLKVFVTLNGNHRGFFVEKDQTSFTVRECDGGSSEVPFDYRVVAKRAGLEDRRLDPLAEELEAEGSEPSTPLVFHRPTDGVDGETNAPENSNGGEDTKGEQHSVRAGRDSRHSHDERPSVGETD